MKEQFVPYEIAIKLQEKGFDWHCLAVYMNGKFQIPRGFGMAIVTTEHVDILKGKAILAPLWQQAFDWLESKHGVAINVTTFVNYEDNKPHIKMFYVHKHPLVIQHKTFECETSDTVKTKCEVIEHALTLI